MNYLTKDKPLSGLLVIWAFQVGAILALAVIGVPTWLALYAIYWALV